MRIGISVKVGSWEEEWYFGTGTGDFAIVQAKITIIGVEIGIFIKV